MARRAPSSAESPSGTPPTSERCRSRPNRRQPPGGAPHRPNTTVPPSFAAPPSTALHSEPRYPPPSPTRRSCHRGARHEDPLTVQSLARRCVSRRRGRTSRSDRVHHACHACRASPGRAESACGPASIVGSVGRSRLTTMCSVFLFFNFIYIS
jgi:hypothetical protein